MVGDNEEGSATLYPHSPYNIAERFINKKFTGDNPYYIFVEGKKDEAMLDWRCLKKWIPSSTISFPNSGNRKRGLLSGLYQGSKLCDGQ